MDLVPYRGEGILSTDEKFLKDCSLIDLYNCYETIYINNPNIKVFMQTVMGYESYTTERKRKYYSHTVPKEKIETYIINDKKGIIVREITQHVFQKLRQIEKKVALMRHEYRVLKDKEKKMIRKHGDLFIVGKEDKKTYIRKPSKRIFDAYHILKPDTYVDFDTPLEEMSKENLEQIYIMGCLSLDVYKKLDSNALSDKHLSKLDDIKDEIYKIMDKEDVEHFMKNEPAIQCTEKELLEMAPPVEKNFLGEPQNWYKAKPMPSVSKELASEKELKKEFKEYKEKIKQKGTNEYYYHKEMEKEEIQKVVEIVDKKRKAKLRWLFAIKGVMIQNRCSFIYNRFKDFLIKLVLNIKEEYDCLYQPIKETIRRAKNKLEVIYNEKEKKHFSNIEKVKRDLKGILRTLRLDPESLDILDLSNIRNKIQKIINNYADVMKENKELKLEIEEKNRKIDKKMRLLVKSREEQRKKKNSDPVGYVQEEINRKLFWAKIKHKYKWCGWTVNDSFKNLLKAVSVPSCLIKVINDCDIFDLNRREKRDLCVFMCRLCIITGSTHAAKLVHLLENPNNNHYTGKECYDNTFGKVFLENDYEAIGAAVSFVSKISGFRNLWFVHSRHFENSERMEKFSMDDYDLDDNFMNKTQADDMEFEEMEGNFKEEKKSFKDEIKTEILEQKNKLPSGCEENNNSDENIENDEESEEHISHINLNEENSGNIETEKETKDQETADEENSFDPDDYELEDLIEM